MARQERLRALRFRDDSNIRKHPGVVKPKMDRAERDYVRQLRGVARHVGELINGFEPGDIQSVPSLVNLLRGYAQALRPWAEVTARKMLLEVNARDLDYWRELSSGISVALGYELRSTPTGDRLRELMGRQVELIASLPIQAGQRVHELTIKGLEFSTRAAQIDDEIRRSGEVCESRATLIARTEVARTASVLTQTRAEAAGSTHYTWETSHDGTVRPGHVAMNGQVCAWASPPAVNENGRIMYHHPGQIWNCRCWPRPILPN